MSETPILDLERDPPKMPRFWWGYVIGAAFGLAILRWGNIDGLWWLPVLYVSIAIHEIGHLVAGRLVGMEIGGMAVGGLRILRSGDRWVVRFSFRQIFGGGFAKPLPKKGEFRRSAYAWMIAGGPIATLLLTAILGILMLRAGTPAGWVSTSFWINGVLLFSTAMPSGGLNKSDIPALLALRDPESARAGAAVLMMQSEETRGVRPRDWDCELVSLMLAYRPKEGDHAYRQMLGFYRKMDEGDEAAALQHLERALAASGRYGRLVRQWSFLEAASVNALIRGDAAAAKVWMERAVKLRKPESRKSLDAAIAQANGQYGEASALWNDALVYIERRKLDSGLVRFAKEQILKYQGRCSTALLSRAAQAD